MLRGELYDQGPRPATLVPRDRLTPRDQLAARPRHHRPISSQLLHLASSSRVQSAFEVLFERDRIVVFGVLGAEDQSDRASPGSLEELLERIRTLFELAAVTLLELVPLRGIVPEPLSEAGARRQILEPGVDPEIVLGNAPRPDPVDQHPVAIALAARS